MIVCQAAVDRFMSIVSSLGGPMELQRARLVIRLSRHYLSDYTPVLYILCTICVGQSYILCYYI